jgi:hypothetical protein
LAKHPGVKPIERGEGVVSLKVVVGYTLLQMLSGKDKLSQEERRCSPCPVGFWKENRILGFLGETKDLLSQFAGRLQFTLYEIKIPQAP